MARKGGDDGDVPRSDVSRSDVECLITNVRCRMSDEDEEQDEQVSQESSDARVRRISCFMHLFYVFEKSFLGFVDVFFLLHAVLFHI